MNYRVLCLTDRSDLPETELFIRLRRTGVDIEVACNPTGRYFERLNASGIPIHELVIPSRFSIKSIRRIRKLLNQGNYDILYCFNNKAVANVLPAAKGKDCHIVTYRGIVGNLSFFSPASWTTHLNPRVRRIICVCNAIKDHLLAMRFLGMHISEEKAVTIYKGHDLDWYQDTPADLRAEFNIPENAFVVCFAGRNRSRKGVQYLLEAAHYLPAEAQIHFLLLGKLTDNRSLKKRIAQCPRPQFIHLAGFRNDAPSIFAASDTFIMPSTEREGLSRAVIEAMAYSTPPIVTAVGGLSELVVNGKSGLVIPPMNSRAIGEAILRLYENHEEKKQMGENARERIRTTFNIDCTVEQTKAVFENLINEDFSTGV